MNLTGTFKPEHVNAEASDFEGNQGRGRIVLLPGSDGRAAQIAERFASVRVKKHPRAHNLDLGTIATSAGAIDVAAVSTGMGGGSIGIGFAIPINSAKFVIDQLLAKGRVVYGYLGVAPKTVSPRLASSLNVSYGALIDMDPTKDSPADKAGLKVGDVVTAVDSKEVHNESELRTIIAQTAPETRVHLTVVREGKTLPLTAVIVEKAGDAVNDAEKPRTGAKAKLGIEVQPLTKRLADQTGFPTDQGVLIKAIDTSSAASENEELSEGCLILKVNSIDTPTVQAFQNAIKSLKSGDMVKLVYLKPSSEREPGKHFTIVEVD